MITSHGWTLLKISSIVRRSSDSEINNYGVTWRFSDRSTDERITSSMNMTDQHFHEIHSTELSKYSLNPENKEYLRP